MTGTRALLFVSCVVAVTAAGRGEAASPSRTVDRTFRCTLSPLYGGLREVEVVARPRGGRTSGTSSDRSAGFISVGSGPGSDPFDALVFARSRLEERVVAPSAPWPPGVYADARRCAPARVSVPLLAKGLPRPPVKFGTDTDCEVRGRVLVRFRAVLEAPTRWRRADPPYFGARRNVREVKIAVRSERTRRPIGLLELDAVGKTRLWTASQCN